MPFSKLLKTGARPSMVHPISFHTDASLTPLKKLVPCIAFSRPRDASLVDSFPDTNNRSKRHASPHAIFFDARTSKEMAMSDNTFLDGPRGLHSVPLGGAEILMHTENVHVSPSDLDIHVDRDKPTAAEAASLSGPSLFDGKCSQFDLPMYPNQFLRLVFIVQGKQNKRQARLFSPGDSDIQLLQEQLERFEQEQCSCEDDDSLQTEREHIMFQKLQETEWQLELLLSTCDD
ncbi:uncharacterized protein BYT42DRAFT_248662 [Radiomyces spectabilis]|uniref:uncharacterized protein n=1 Tax=Radiomyces spectabilis TaxID=64574 RepID=UPI00221F137F|nr:uncharacterized protein BYT42DRAFT_248662 [Radiomyces spectabilis]KAI8388839.1 hypothetical protein BYT42DRAFT_248662 [Radiomyces spectabilis]